ncbi:VOC family protein [Paenibacillus puerhi]|uniref:VOC family protein n=1 Tax=Paenibacillus puerhi TaxID=2692622 RepID=UPI00135AEE99|nr:VOC family protein [Paenibacillus puerhi]
MNNNPIDNREGTSFIEGIEYTEIPVADLEKGIDWYCNKLGAKLGYRNEDLAYVDFSMGPSLFLVKTSDLTSSTFLVNGEDHYTIGFRVTLIEEFRNYLLTLGTQVSVIKDEGAIGKFFTFYDPFGNMFDVHQPAKRMNKE